MNSAVQRREGGVYVGEPSETLRAALGLYPARIAFLDEVEPARMQRAAYLVLDDGAMRGVIEAFASGLPVIASASGMAAALVEPGRNGLLFEPRSARELARRLAWAEAFPEKMRQMGECARADYRARFIADWGWQTLFAERRRSARA